MRWLYRLQTRLGLTGPEGSAALALVLALTGGIAAQHVQASADPIPADFYAAADAAFATAAADTTVIEATPAEPAGAPLGLMASAEPVADSPAEDSSAAQLASVAVAAAAAPRRSRKPPPVRTNINTASEAALQRLPRIGPALAGRIVAYRRTNGPFRSPDQITEVKGIGEKTLERLRPWIYI